MEKLMREIVPVGGSGGRFRIDAAAGAQKVIAVLISAGVLIDFIQLMVYQNNSPQVLAPHGGDGGHFTAFVLANDEYLTGFTGWYGLYLDSITLHTNKRTSQRFGGHGGEREYAIHANSGEQIVGLLSHSENFVHAIGAIIIPAPRY